MAYGEFKDLARRALSNKILRDKAFNIAKNLKYDEYQCRLAYWLMIFLIKKKTSGSGIKNEQKNYTNQLLKNLEKKSTLNFYRQYLGC